MSRGAGPPRTPVVARVAGVSSTTPANPSEPAPPQVPNVNIANALTVLRLILVPVLAWFLLPGDTAADWWWAFAVFTLAALTDKLDGYLARSRGLVTNFGKLADSIADKALVITALVLLSWHELLPWWVTVLMIVRELGITLLRMVMVRKEVMAAGGGGKLKMVLQVAVIMVLLVPWWSFTPAGVADAIELAGLILALITLVVSYWSAAQYVRDAIAISRR